MDAEIEVRENPAPEKGVLSKSHDLDVTFAGNVQIGASRLTVEYRARKVVLAEGALCEYVPNPVDLAPERLVFDLYMNLVEVLFPGEASYEKPWEYVPMVVSLDYETYPLYLSVDGEENHLAVGSY